MQPSGEMACPEAGEKLCSCMCKPGILQSGESSEAMFAEGIAQRLGEARYEWGMVSVRLWHRRHCNGDEDVLVIVMITLATVIISFHK